MITIIVLLILIGIIIASLTGSGGLVEKAKIAADNARIMQIRDEVDSKLTSLNSDKWVTENRPAKLNDLNEFDNEQSRNYDKNINLKEEVENEDVTAILIYEGYEIEIVEENGTIKISKIDGISTIALADESNNGESGSESGGDDSTGNESSGNNFEEGGNTGNESEDDNNEENNESIPILKEGILANGSWNSSKGVNSPKIEGTGLLPIYYNANGDVVELNSESSDEEWNKWYDYADTSNVQIGANGSHWANAITKGQDATGAEIITGYWVWIPRYAYQIADNLQNGGSNVNGTINIKFLKGTGFIDEDGINRNGAYETEQIDVSSYSTTKRMKNYVVHPSFKDGTNNNYENGEWRAEIPGFWVAKYEAGFQQCSQSINEGTIQAPVINETNLSKVVYSTSMYTSFDTTNIQTNALKQKLEASENNKMSYPVFKSLTYSYNVISIGDAFTISRQIQNANTFYRLNNVDSHLMKNSEWGAVAYLTHSVYGRNKLEVAQNRKNIDRGTIRSVTGYSGQSAENVGNASSTGNMTGIFDLRGGIIEMIPAYISNGHYNLSKHGSSFATAKISTEYATIYPYDTSSDKYNTNYNEYLKSKMTRYGDAILETSDWGSGQNSWMGNYSYYAETSSCFFMRGGHVSYSDSPSETGIFYFHALYPEPSKYRGFRSVLVNTGM